MSHFVGIVRWGDDRRLDRPDAQRLAAAVAAPGPLRAQHHSAPPFHAAFQPIALTPEDAWEPPRSAEEVVCLFAGRIDDREGAAGRLGLSLDRTPDSVLASEAFRRWGDQAAQEVIGEFAWAAWDGARRRLVLARDISPAHALYVYRSERLVAFATTLRALLSLPDVPREIDDEGLADFLAVNPAKGVRTMYRGVHRVMPGTTLVIEAGRPSRILAWQPRPVDVPRKPDACAEAAREVFGRAMDARLRVLGPTAISLSGGLDSSIVAAEAALRRSPDPVLGFVLVPKPGVPLSVRPWEAPDDRAQVDALSRRYPNLRITFVEPDIDPLDADPTALFMEAAQPAATAPSLTWSLAGWRAARKAGARLLIGGGDGEMSLTHYGSLRAVVLQGDIWHAVREAWLGGRRKQGRFLGHLDRAFLDGRLSRLRHRGDRALPGNWHRYSALNPDFAEATGVRDRLTAEGFPRGFFHTQLGQRQIVERTLRWRAGASEGLAIARQLTGLAHTCPYSDRRVIEFCLSLPESMFVRDGWTRWLARAAFRDVLPPEVRERTVKAVQNGEWFHRISPHRDAFRAQLACIETSPLAARALDLPRLKALLDQWPTSLEEAEAAGPAYRAILPRALQTGAFLRWLDATNTA